MRQNTMLLVRNEQKPEQRKDRKYNNNMKKAGRVQESTQRVTRQVNNHNPLVKVKSDRGNNVRKSVCHS